MVVEVDHFVSVLFAAVSSMLFMRPSKQLRLLQSQHSPLTQLSPLTCYALSFRTMDEFDVFLDAVARNIALDTLVESSSALGHWQFIFLSPQDLNTVAHAEFEIKDLMKKLDGLDEEVRRLQ
jgi:hypothetical protein